MRVKEQTPVSSLHCAACRAVQGASSKVIRARRRGLAEPGLPPSPAPGSHSGRGHCYSGTFHMSWASPQPLHQGPSVPTRGGEGQEPVCCAGCWLSEAGTALGGWSEGFCQGLSLVSRGLISCAGNTHAQATHAEVKKERFYWASPVGETRAKRHTWDTPRAFLLRSARQPKFQKAIVAFL